MRWSITVSFSRRGKSVMARTNGHLWLQLGRRGSLKGGGAHGSGGVARGGRKTAGDGKLPTDRKATGVGGRLAALAGSSTR
jgi:hypothetical protein